MGSAFVLDVSKPVFGSHVTTCSNGHNIIRTIQFLKFRTSSERLTVVVALGILTVDTDDKFVNNADIVLLLLCPTLHLGRSTK